jgi:hypothetical protein
MPQSIQNVHHIRSCRYEVQSMKALFWVGLVVLILGVVLLLVPIPQREKHGIEAGGASIGVETKHDEKVPPLYAGLMIAGGAVLMIAGRRRGGPAA